jgi:hypothetical protein
MNCDCINVVEKKLAEFRKPLAGDDAVARMENIGWMINENKAVTVINMPFRVKGSKKGYTTDKGKIDSITASFCPFCGKSTKPAEVA